MADNLELLSIGDSAVDVYLTPTEADVYCEIKHKESLLCFSFGDKIPVKNLEFSVGGNAANNAVGTRRLGINSAAVLTLGDDSIGYQIVDTLEKEGVNMNYVIQQPSTTSNYSTIISFGGERTIFSYKSPRSYEFPVQLPQVGWVYLTSMGDSFRPFYNHMLDWLKKNQNTKLAFNPGSRQLRAGVDELKEVLSLCDVVYVNRKEAEMLTKVDSREKGEKELLKALSGLGPKISIITDGADGSFIYDGQRFIRAGIIPVDAYERTGAGDAFGSGCLAAIIKGKSLQDALMWGTLNSSSVIGYAGPQRGLLKEADMPIWIERASSSGMKVEEF